MGEIDKLAVRIKHQNIAALSRQSGVHRTTIARMLKSRDGAISTLDKINEALDFFNVKRVPDDYQPKEN